MKILSVALIFLVYEKSIIKQIKYFEKAIVELFGNCKICNIKKVGKW